MVGLTIWKYKLEITGEQEIEMPLGASILSVGVQGEDVCLWAVVNPDAEMVNRKFIIKGTGHSMSFAEFGTLHFIGTAQQDFVGATPVRLVWHIFEEPMKKARSQKRDG